MEFPINTGNEDRSKTNQAKGNQVNFAKIEIHSTQTNSRIDFKWLDLHYFFIWRPRGKENGFRTWADWKNNEGQSGTEFGRVCWLWGDWSCAWLRPITCFGDIWSAIG